MRLVDRVSTDVLRDRVGVVVKIENKAVCGGVVMSSVKTSPPKYVRLWSFK